MEGILKMVIYKGENKNRRDKNEELYKEEQFIPSLPGG